MTVSDGSQNALGLGDVIVALGAAQAQLRDAIMAEDYKTAALADAERRRLLENIPKQALPTDAVAQLQLLQQDSNDLEQQLQARMDKLSALTGRQLVAWRGYLKAV